MLGLTPQECHTRRQEACRRAVRAFQWRARLVTKATKQYGLAEEFAEEVLTFFGATSDALASEIWILAHWKRVACTPWAYMEEAFQWRLNPWRTVEHEDTSETGTTTIAGPFGRC